MTVDWLGCMSMFICMLCFVLGLLLQLYNLLQVSSIDCGITGRFIVHGGHQLGLVIATGYVHCLKFIQFVNFSACMLYGRWHLVSLG